MLLEKDSSSLLTSSAQIICDRGLVLLRIEVRVVSLKASSGSMKAFCSFLALFSKRQAHAERLHAIKRALLQLIFTSSTRLRRSNLSR